MKKQTPISFYFSFFLFFLLLHYYPQNKKKVGLCRPKLAEPPYNLRSKGNMSATENPTEHALVIADNPGWSREKDDTRNNEHVARMAQEMASLREEVQHINHLVFLLWIRIRKKIHKKKRRWETTPGMVIRVGWFPLLSRFVPLFPLYQSKLSMKTNLLRI